MFKVLLLVLMFCVFAIVTQAQNIGMTTPPVNLMGNDVAGALTGQIACGTSAFYDGATSGEHQIIALITGKTVYVCGYVILMPNAPSAGQTVQLDYGTGTNCAIGTTHISPAFGLSHVDASPYFRGLSAPSGNAVCVNTGAASQMQVLVYYTQF